MRILAIVHQPDAGPGVFAPAVIERGGRLETWEPSREHRAPDPGGYAAILSFGGGMHADQEEAHPWLIEEKRLLRRALELGLPVLGVCLGAQILAEAAGAPAHRASRPEIGWYAVRTTPEAAADPLLGPLSPGFQALEWHSYEFPLPAGAVPLAASDTCLQAFRLGVAAWGIQFHAEVDSSTFKSWLTDYQQDPDAVAVGLDPHELWARSTSTLPAWNQLGRELCGRFVEMVQNRVASSAAG